jgi:hypothetical protein
MKIIFHVIVCLFFYNLAYGQSEEFNKKQLYEQEQRRIEQLENAAQYSGDDKLIRDRLNLPPKLPSLELWNPDVEKKENFSSNSKDSSTKLDTSNLEKTASSQDTTSNGNENKNKDSSSNSQGQNSELSKYPKTNIEKYISLAIYSLLVLLNFAIYLWKPALRKFMFATPFDIGVKKDPSDTTQKWKRYMLELTLLIGVSFFLLSQAVGELKITENVDYTNDILINLKTFFSAYIFYLLVRFIIGYRSKCPKCKTPFAAKTVNSYEEPKSTYVGRGGGGVARYNWENGLKHQEYLCTCCGHEWKKVKSYKKNLGQVSSH